MINGRLQFWVRQELLGPVVFRLRPMLRALAYVWRRLLFRTTFIAVTGSVGKTTAKECLAGILSSRHLTYKTYRNQGGALLVVLNILKVRPWHRFAVLEVGIDAPNTMGRIARLLKPDVAVVSNVLRTHTTAFRDLQQHADEKAVLLKALAPGGLALLNTDDPLVAAMRHDAQFRFLSFGTSPECDFRADCISAKWPNRLKFDIHSGSETVSVQTQLVGAHWLSSALAALGVANSLRMSLPDAARAFRNVEPFSARLQPIRLPGGAIVLRDDYSASIDTMVASLRVLEEASAERRLLVMTDMSDSGMNQRQRLKYLGPAISRVAEVAVFIGRNAEYAKRRTMEAGMVPENVHTFPELKPAAEFLKTELKPGDLMLLKGRTTDHVTRIFFAQFGPVGCWKTYCDKTMLCDICWELDVAPDQMHKAAVVEPYQQIT